MIFQGTSMNHPDSQLEVLRIDPPWTVTTPNFIGLSKKVVNVYTNVDGGGEGGGDCTIV